jgi:hypothetical protein
VSGDGFQSMSLLWTRYGRLRCGDSGEIDVDKPLLTVDRQMGLVIVTPEGKVGSVKLGLGFW